MGCGESKHDAVATGNTFLRRKKSTKRATAEPAREPHVTEDQSNSDNTIPDPKEHRATDVANRENDVASTVVEERDVKNDDNINVVDNKESNDDIDSGEKGGQDDQLVISDQYDTPPRGSSANPTAEDGLNNKPADDEDQDQGDQIDGQNNVISTSGDQELLAENTDQPKPDQQDKITGEEKTENVEEKEELEVSVPAPEEANITPNPESDEKHVVDSPTKELKTV